MKLRLTGFYNELNYGFEGFSNLKDSIDNFKFNDSELVCNYLAQGKIFLIAPGISFDIISNNRSPICGKSILTDGI